MLCEGFDCDPDVPCCNSPSPVLNNGDWCCRNCGLVLGREMVTDRLPIIHLSEDARRDQSRTVRMISPEPEIPCLSHQTKCALFPRPHPAHGKVVSGQVGTSQFVCDFGEVDDRQHYKILNLSQLARSPPIELPVPLVREVAELVTKYVRGLITEGRRACFAPLCAGATYLVSLIHKKFRNPRAIAELYNVSERTVFRSYMSIKEKLEIRISSANFAIKQCRFDYYTKKTQTQIEPDLLIRAAMLLPMINRALRYTALRMNMVFLTSLYVSANDLGYETNVEKWCNLFEVNRDSFKAVLRRVVADSSIPIQIKARIHPTIKRIVDQIMLVFEEAEESLVWICMGEMLLRGDETAHILCQLFNREEVDENFLNSYWRRAFNRSKIIDVFNPRTYYLTSLV